MNTDLSNSPTVQDPSDSRERPSIPEIETELERLKTNRSRRNSIRYVVIVSLLMAALIILATNLWFPVLRVVGSSMQPTLQSDDVVICFNRAKTVERGDVIAFYNNDKILLKRVIGLPGDLIEIDSVGTVFVNGDALTETYVLTPSLEPCDITFPVIVPDDAYFVLGDQRATSMDSRSASIGMIDKERLIGKALVNAWPLTRFQIL